MKLLIDFESLNGKPEKAMLPVTRLFTRAGMTPVSVMSDGKSRRLAGVSFREVSMTFSDNQTLALRVKATGDVYEVRVNGRMTPVSNQTDPAKAVAELVKMLDTGRARFQKRLAAMAMKPPAGIKTAAPKLKEALTAQIAEVDAAIEGAREELAELQAA